MQTGAGGAPLVGVVDGVAARPDAAAPALRLPDPQAALRPLHPGDGRARLRHAARAVPGRLRGVDGELEPGAHHRAGLQRRLDAAQRRRAVHPRRRDHPAAAGQHRPSGRRGVRPARARQHPGLHGHPHAVQPAARLPADAQRRAHDRPRDATWTPSAAARRRASGRPPTPTWCRCSRSTSASTPRRRTTSASTYLPRINGDHGTYRTVMDMVDGERSSATSCSGRTRPSARRTASCSGWAWRTWTGWSSATSR